MYCGSCMHDNALAKALRRAGTDCLLQPLYTPIRTDENSVASAELFFGGVNIYLTEVLPLYRYAPRGLRRLLDSPRFIRWVTRRATSTDAAALGELTLSMLRGESGKQRAEVLRLTRWLRDEIHPDVIILTNLLIAGPLPTIRRQLPQTRLLTILQGDDLFLDHLPPHYREAAIAQLSQLGLLCDALIVNSRFYAQHMGRMLGLGEDRFRLLPLGIDTEPYAAAGHSGDGSAASPAPRRVGYLARIAPEKGLHHLVTAFIDLARRPGQESLELDFAGYLGPQYQGYLDEQLRRLDEAGLADRARYLGSPDLQGKVELLRRLDLFSVPTEHLEPKGLSVLEAMACGVPVVLPATGAFPEIVEPSGGGVLVPPDPHELADAMQRLLEDDGQRRRLGQAARQWVLQHRHVDAQARTLIELISDLASERTPERTSEPTDLGPS